MNIRKNRSGNWEIRQMIDGKAYQRTVKGKKPSEYEAMQLILELVDAKKRPSSISFYDAANEYIQSRANIISPKTLCEYLRFDTRLPRWFLDLNVYDINQQDMQRMANEISVNHSPKTVHNRHGFAVSVIRFYRPTISFNTTFKPIPHPKVALPTKEQVDLLINDAKGTMFYIPLQLAKYSMRRSEICALLTSDITDDDQIHVYKALVQDKNGEWVIKETKTPESERYIPIDADLAKEIRSLDRERIYEGFPGSITNYLKRRQAILGIPPFGVHTLRHYYASALHWAGVDDITIQETGGWKNNTVLKRRYTHSDVEINASKKDKIRNAIK